MSKNQPIPVRATAIPGIPVISATVFDVKDSRVPAGNKAVQYSFMIQILVNEDPNDPSTHIYSEPNWGLQSGKTKEQTAASIIQQHVDYWYAVVNGGLNSVDIEDIHPTPPPEEKPVEQIAKEQAQQALSQAIQTYNSVSAGVSKGILKVDDADLPAAKQYISDILAIYPEFKNMLASIK